MAEHFLCSTDQATLVLSMMVKAFPYFQKLPRQTLSYLKETIHVVVINEYLIK